MKNTQYQEMYQEYQKGFSLAEIGKMFGITRQAVYSGFKCRRYKLRAKKLLPFLSFKGIRFTLRNHGYYSRTDNSRELMHRYVWEYFNGKIPEGHDVHHLDRNRSNNDIKNLEVMRKDEHSRRFNTGHNQYTKTNNVNRKS